MKTPSQEHRDSARRRPDSSDFQLCRRVSWIRMFILLLFLFGINSFFFCILNILCIYIFVLKNTHINYAIILKFSGMITF